MINKSGFSSSSTKRSTVVQGLCPLKSTSPDKAKCKVYTLDGKAASLSNSYAGVEVGQIYYNDGTCSSQDYDAANTTKTPIGVVVSTNSTYCEPTADNDKYGHGLVMALKDASTGAAWGPLINESLNEYTKLAEFYKDASGLANTNAIYNAHQSSTTFDTDYPAFYAAINYKNTVTFPPSSSSGWFLPSIGQWWDALEKAAAYNGTSLGLLDVHESTAGNYESGVDGTTVVKALNHLLTTHNIGTNLYNTFNDKNFQFYWSSSEHSTNNACNVSWDGSGGSFYLDSGSKALLVFRYVRPFLAF